MDQLLECTSRNVKVTSDWTVLHFAVDRGHDEVVARLLDHCPELIETIDSDRVLTRAALLDHGKVFEQLLARNGKLPRVPFLHNIGQARSNQGRHSGAGVSSHDGH